MSRTRSSENGFSLLEALIAMAILALVTGAIVSAAQTHIDRVAGLEHRAAALWVAENELSVMQVDGKAPAEGARSLEMVGEIWRIDVTTRNIDDPDLLRIDIDVRGNEDEQPAARLTGFIDTGDRP